MFRFGIKPDDECLYCGEHTFIKCPFTKTSVQKVVQWFNQTNLCLIFPIIEEVLFGYFSSACDPRIKKKFNYTTLAMRQYCAKVMQTKFDEIPGFLWLFEEISLQAKSLRQFVTFRRIFDTSIVLICANFRAVFRCVRYFAANFQAINRELSSENSSLFEQSSL